MNTTELTVLVTPAPAVHGWRARFRPAGPAGHITVRLPFGITVYLDRAQPDLTLEVASASGDPAATALLATLFGPESAALAEQGRAGEAVRRPDEGEAARSLLALLLALGTAPQLPALVIVDQAAQASRLATEFAAAGEEEMTRLLERIATVCALRGAGALRLLPAPSQLGLGPVERRLLGDAVQVVRLLAGPDIVLGPVDDAGTTPPDPLELLGDEQGVGSAGPELLVGSILAGLRSRVRAGIPPAVSPPSGAYLIDASEWDLPVQVEQLWMTGTAARGYQVEGTVSLLTVDDEEVIREIASPDSPSANPVIWARALRPGDGMVMYAARCLISGGRLRATLHVNADFDSRNGFWIDLAVDPASPRRLLSERRADAARRQGAHAVDAQRVASTAEQWKRVSALWNACARLWSLAGDGERATLATIHAMRARIAAGETVDPGPLARDKATLDPRWLAPDLAQRAQADPLGITELMPLAFLGKHLTDWVSGELAKAVNVAVPILNRQYLEYLLNLLPASGNPADAEVRRLRARARAALAYHASRRTETLPLASVLMAAASADWPYLNEQGRQHFAAANLALIEQGHVDDLEELNDQELDDLQGEDGA